MAGQWKFHQGAQDLRQLAGGEFAGSAGTVRIGSQSDGIRHVAHPLSQTLGRRPARLPGTRHSAATDDPAPVCTAWGAR